MPFNQIAEALITCDPKVLTLTILESLEVIAPTDEEVGLLKGYDGDRNLLANPEKFVDEIKNVKGFIHRIKSLKFTKVQDELFNDLEPKAEKLANTFKQLPSNNKIVKIMEYALALGNYLNGTTPRGGAWGFKLDQMDKFFEVKTQDNKRNLLVYLY